MPVVACYSSDGFIRLAAGVGDSGLTVPPGILLAGGQPVPAAALRVRWQRVAQRTHICYSFFNAGGQPRCWTPNSTLLPAFWYVLP